MAGRDFDNLFGVDWIGYEKCCVVFARRRTVLSWSLSGKRFLESQIHLSAYGGQGYGAGGRGRVSGRFNYSRSGNQYCFWAL